MLGGLCIWWQVYEYTGRCVYMLTVVCICWQVYAYTYGYVYALIGVYMPADVCMS